MVYSCKLIESSDTIQKYGYYDDDEEVGSCSMKLYTRGEHKGSYLLMSVVIHEAHRGKGLCNKFLKCVLKKYPGKTVFLSVLMNNDPAIKCYEHLGFVEVERGRSTLWMRKA